ncbi:phage major capsid protein [Microvirga sp. 2YAF29]|uniref:phage major capsid protein n=1 Tax=Microvirga sp. 2YAF29 TaxID=3233031 RepID=UPI003F9E7F0F
MKHFPTQALETKSAVLEIKEEGGGDDVPAAIAALQATFEEKMTGLQNEVKAANERADELELKVNRPGNGSDKVENEAEVKAFETFTRKGREALSADETKALRVADDTAGGYLAPDQFVAEIQRDLVEFSPIRQAARVGDTSAGAVILPKRTGRMTAKWVGEIEQRPKTEPAYGQIEIPQHEIAAYVDVSNWLLEDAAVDIAAELAFDFAEEFGRLEGVAFVNGDGVKKPVGIMADPNVPMVLNGHAANLSPDSLIKVMYDLPAFYRNRGSWLLNGTSIAAIRLLKDSSGKFLWQESLAEGQPPTLLGRPVVEAVDMADVEANAFPIAYGDFGSAYRIYDRVGLSILRDPYSVQTEGLVRFHGRKRVGGGVVRPEAIRKLKMATS